MCCLPCLLCGDGCVYFVFVQMTAYEVRISDWSSDVCSSDLSLTVMTALISVLWMLGALRLLGFGIDPMNMLTPFLIFAIAVSHGEQMINRFRGEIFFGGLEEGSVEELRSEEHTLNSSH